MNVRYPWTLESVLRKSSVESLLNHFWKISITCLAHCKSFFHNHVFNKLKRFSHQIAQSIETKLAKKSSSFFHLSLHFFFTSKLIKQCHWKFCCHLNNIEVFRFCNFSWENFNYYYFDTYWFFLNHKIWNVRSHEFW